MKRALSLALGSIVLSAALTSTASAATEAQKLAAILSGLAHLDYIQCKTAGSTKGQWSSGGCSGSYADAFTGAAVFAFLTQKAKWPANLANQYSTDVVNGINYLLSTATVTQVSTNSNNVNICPSGTGTCPAVYWNVSGESTYATGFVSGAIATYATAQGPANVATASGPLAGLTWTQICQGITNAYAAAQATTANSTRNGGWRYSIPSDGDADMSTTQWGAISAGYDESVGATTPATLKPALQKWLAFDLFNNQACYYGSSGCSIGPTHAENGAWLVSNAYAGSASSTAGPIGFLNTNWKNTANSTWYGNFGHTYAMWSVYKGLEATIGLADTTSITNLNSDCGKAAGNLPGSGVCNWWEDYNQFLVTNLATSNGGNPTTDGGTNQYWPGYNAETGWQDPMSTSVFVAILGAAALPTSITGSPSAPVPVLSKWALVGLGILLAAFAATRLRGTRTA